MGHCFQLSFVYSPLLQINEYPVGSGKGASVGGGRRWEMAVCTRGQMSSAKLGDGEFAAFSGAGATNSLLASKASVFFRTMLVTVSPRFIFVNRTGEVVEVCQTSYEQRLTAH